MPALVPNIPTPSTLRTQLVAAPVSAASCGRVWASQLAFLLGRALPIVASFRLPAFAVTSDAVTVPIAWWPSPGCRLAAVVVDLAAGELLEGAGRLLDGAFRSVVSVSVPSGAGLVHDVVGGASGSLDGSTLLPQQAALRVGRSSYCSLVHLGDVGDVADAITDILVTIDAAAGEVHAGLAQITVFEIPLATLRPETGEVGVLTPAIDPRTDLHDGDSAIGSGVPEILDAERAVIGVREHLQIGTYRDTTRCWVRSSMTIGPIDFVGTAGTNDPWFRVRIRATHGTSAATPANFRLRVHHNSTEDWTLRVVRAVVGGGSSDHDESVAASGGSWAIHDSNLTLRADGTDQEIDLRFRASSLDGSPVYLASIALVQEETV